MSISSVTTRRENALVDVADEASAVGARAAERKALQDPGASSDAGVPLVVDLDGTLVRSDLLIEAAFSRLGARPTATFGMVAALLQGKAAFKHFVCSEADLDPATLPYDKEVLGLIERARAEGRSVYLASACHWQLVERVADHLGVFDDCLATDQTTNLAGAAKAQRLIDRFGEGKFDYIGNDAADLPVWARARRAITIRASRRVRAQLESSHPDALHLSHETPTWKKWARQFRVHQYAKNVLVFLPLLAAQISDPILIATAALAAVSFSLFASATYVLNDLFDLREDRLHRTKKFRPLACGEIPLIHALAAVPLLCLGGLAIGLFISPAFTGVVLAYFALTLLYSMKLKRIMLIDVLTLATLYSIRILGGAVAVGISLSIWLLIFSLSLFLSLALLKRFVELTARLDAGLPNPSNRDYQKGDVNILAALAAAAGFNAVTILALYVSNATVYGPYSNPQMLWFACPILIYWIGRALILAQRRQMKDDPVVFALKDRQSQLSSIAMFALFVAAT